MKSRLTGIAVLLTAFALFFSSCQKTDTDPCLGKTCLNNGTCISGTCNCPQGWTGADCNSPITPRRMYIQSVTVTHFPATNQQGYTWDNLSGPDIYPVIVQNSSVLWNSPSYNGDAINGIHYSFVPSQGVAINPLQQCIIGLFDYDAPTDPDDEMGNITFTPYAIGTGFPSIATLDAGNGLAFELSLKYEW